MEERCVLVSLPNHKIACRILQRGIGSGDWMAAKEFDVTDQLPALLAVLQAQMPPPPGEPCEERLEDPEGKGDADV